MKLFKILCASAVLLTGAYAYAEGHCNCSKECHDNCKKGEKTEACHCKACDCAKSGKCSDESCKKHEHNK